jgi:hypothetical protein
VAHIDVDTLRHFITPTGYVAPGRPGFDRQQALSARNACGLACNFIEERFAVIIDEVVIEKTHLSQYIEGLAAAGVPVHYVRLLPTLEVCLARNLARDPETRMRPERIATVWAQFEAAGDIGGATIDSSKLTPYETADKLQALTTSGASIVWAPQ